MSRGRGLAIELAIRRRPPNLFAVIRMLMRIKKTSILCCAVLVTAVATSATVAPVRQQSLPTTADSSAAEETINLAVTGMT